MNGTVEDFVAWQSRAEGFFAGIERRLPGKWRVRRASGQVVTEQQLQSVEIKLGFALPTVYRSFLEAGLGGFNHSFSWDFPIELQEQVRPVFRYESRLFMGPGFLRIKQLPAATLDCRGWAENYNELPEEQKLIANTLPFVSIGNGDYVAFDMQVKMDDPPVVFFAHEEGAFKISPSFTEFLRTWEMLCYIGPESWMLRPFQNENRLLESASEKAKSLRILLGAEG